MIHPERRRKRGHLPVHHLRGPNRRGHPQQLRQIPGGFTERFLHAESLLPVFQEVRELAGRQPQVGVQGDCLDLLPLPRAVHKSGDGQLPENRDIAACPRLRQTSQRPRGGDRPVVGHGPGFSGDGRDINRLPLIAISGAGHMRGHQVASHGHEFREHHALNFVNSASFLAGTPHALRPTDPISRAP